VCVKEVQYVFFMKDFTIFATQNIIATVLIVYRILRATFSSQNTYFCLCHFVTDLANNSSDNETPFY